MITSTPKVVVIGDELPHLTALADVLEDNGVQCLRIHYDAEQNQVPARPNARLIIADLHLGSGVLGADPTPDYSALGALLENNIRPVGAYAMLLWTRYPEHASELETFLGRLQGVRKPSMLKALPKAGFLDSLGRVIDGENLNRRINDLAGGWIRPRGALALVGAWGELEEDEIDALIDEIYTNRSRSIVESETGGT